MKRKTLTLDIAFFSQFHDTILLLLFFCFDKSEALLRITLSLNIAFFSQFCNKSIPSMLCTLFIDSAEGSWSKLKSKLVCPHTVYLIQHSIISNRISRNTVKFHNCLYAIMRSPAQRQTNKIMVMRNGRRVDVKSPSAMSVP